MRRPFDFIEYDPEAAGKKSGMFDSPVKRMSPLASDTNFEVGNPLRFLENLPEEYQKIVREIEDRRAREKRK